MSDMTADQTDAPGAPAVPGVPAVSGVPSDAAVVDRIEDGTHAVLLVGAEEVELVLDAALLPEGTREGDWLRIGLTPDPERTATVRDDLEARLERIRRTRGGSRFV
jgi:hypothetical protein